MQDLMKHSNHTKNKKKIIKSHSILLGPQKIELLTNWNLYSKFRHTKQLKHELRFVPDATKNYDSKNNIIDSDFQDFS